MGCTSPRGGVLLRETCWALCLWLQVRGGRSIRWAIHIANLDAGRDHTAQEPSQLLVGCPLVVNDNAPELPESLGRRFSEISHTVHCTRAQNVLLQCLHVGQKFLMRLMDRRRFERWIGSDRA